MASRLTYRFEPLADLYFLLTDPQRCPPSEAWAPAREAISRCLSTLAAASRGRVRTDGAFHGHVAEHVTIDELAADVPEDGLLGLPWTRLVELAVEALRAGEPPYASELLAGRRAVVTNAIDQRIRPQLDPKERESLAFIHDALGLPDDDREVHIVLTASVPHLPFTSLSDRYGAISFIGVAGLDGSALLETVLHEATHALEWSGPNDSILARLAQRVHEAFGDAPALRQVAHSLIFVQAAETVRRIVDPRHVHYGVTHTYYDRVPVSKPVVEHWVAHLDGAYDADTAIERIVDDLRR